LKKVIYTDPTQENAEYLWPITTLLPLPHIKFFLILAVKAGGNTEA